MRFSISSVENFFMSHRFDSIFFCVPFQFCFLRGQWKYSLLPFDPEFLFYLPSSLSLAVPCLASMEAYPVEVSLLFSPPVVFLNILPARDPRRRARLWTQAFRPL